MTTKQGDRNEVEVWRHMLVARPVKNEAAGLDRDDRAQSMIVSIERRKPWFLIPPISWLVRLNLTHRFQLDQLGLVIWDLCDGMKTVEDIIDNFAERFRLSFHEARVSVTGHLKELVQRGALVLVLDNQEEMEI